MPKKAKRAREAGKWMASHAPAQKPEPAGRQPAGYTCVRCGAKLDGGPARQDTHNVQAHLAGA